MPTTHNHTDNKDTAEGVCREIGLYEKDEDTTGTSFTGQEFDLMTEEQQLQCVRTAKLFARAVPDHKKIITERLQVREPLRQNKERGGHTTHETTPPPTIHRLRSSSAP